MPNGIRTEWHLADLTDADVDPFATVLPEPSAEVDLTASPEELEQVLRELLYTEGNYEAMGLTCRLKDGGQDCRTCSRATSSSDDPMAALCGLGKRQAAIAGRAQELSAHRLRPALELAQLAAECSELGHLDADEVAALDAAGL